MSIEIHHDSVLGSTTVYTTDDYLFNDEYIRLIEVCDDEKVFDYTNVIKQLKCLEIRRNIHSVNGI